MIQSHRISCLLLVLALMAGAACTSRLISQEPEVSKSAGAVTEAADAPPRSADEAPLRELRDIAERSYDETEALFESGEATPFEVYQASRRWLDEELALARGADDKVTFQQAHLDRMRDLANYSLWRTSEVEFYVAEAELQFDKLRPDPALLATVLARKALQGEWEVVSAEEDGEALKKPDMKSLTIVGRRGDFVFRLGSARALLTLDPTATPHLLDVFGLSEAFPFGGHGIYKLDANQLTVCWAASGERPKTFATRPGDDARLYVLKRAKPQ